MEQTFRYPNDNIQKNLAKITEMVYIKERCRFSATD